MAIVLVTTVAMLTACGASNDPGTMTGQQYRSLAAQQSTLTVQEVTSTGGVQSSSLERRWVQEGGAATAETLDCWYAETTSKTRYRGTARFCFDDQGKAVSVERNRADLPDPAPDPAY